MSFYLLGICIVAFSFQSVQAANPQEPMILWPEGALLNSERLAA